MHGMSRFLFSYLLFALSIFCFSTPKAFADTVTLVADKWCPYNCAPNSSNPGLLIEIAEYGLKKGGHTVVYSVMPWARAIEESRAGKYSGLIGATTEEVPDFIYPKVGLAKSSDSLYVRKENPWRYTDMNSLKKISLGVIQDYFYSEEIDQYIKKHSKDPAHIQLASGEDPLELNIKKLEAGRIGAIIDDKYVIDYYLSTHGLNEKIIPAGTIGDDIDVYVAFSPALPKSSEYAQLVTEGVSELLSNGKMNEILLKYDLK